MKVKELIASRIEAAFDQVGLTGPAIVQTTSSPKLGDFQVNGVMAAAKKAKLDPSEKAKEVIEAVKLEDIALEVSFAKPGFINIKLAPDFLKHLAPDKITQDDQALNIVVDYSAPNLAKEMHVGHLRSTIIGDSMANILESKGHNVIRQNHVGDWGTQFGMLLTYMHEQGHASHLLADLEDFYRSAKKQFDSDEDFSNRSREAVVNLQSGKAFESEHWKTFIETSMSHCEEIYEKLRVGLNSSHVRGESSYNAALPEVINIFKESNLLEESEGAQCIFFEGQKSPLIVQKADGGFLYATTDLAAIRYRVNELEANRILYFVDSRQSLHFRQIFAAIELADLNPKAASLEHMAFGTMLNEEGKPFKTREGGLIKLKPLIEEAISRATRTVLEKNPEISEHKAQEIGEIIGIAAIKYADLSKNRTNDYIFDWDQMLSLEGNTAPYLLYAYTRIQSLITRSGRSERDLVKMVAPEDESERLLCVELIKLDEVVDQVAKDGYPHLLCNHLYSVATTFNQFYEQSAILNQPEETMLRRLSLTHATGRTLQKGLSLLGIDVVDKM